MLERDLEKWCVGQARKRGCRFPKFVSPANRAVADRILQTPQRPTENPTVVVPARSIYVELKRTGEKLTKQQAKWHRDMIAEGHDCRMIDSKEAFLELLDEVAPL